MSFGQSDTLAVVAVVVAFVVGASLVARGGMLLSEAQREELAALSPDWIGLGGLATAFVFGWLAPQLHIWSVVGAAISAAVFEWRVPVRLYRRPWPPTARLLLFSGNAMFALGSVIFAALRAVPYIGG